MCTYAGGKYAREFVFVYPSLDMRKGIYRSLAASDTSNNRKKGKSLRYNNNI